MDERRVFDAMGLHPDLRALAENDPVIAEMLKRTTGYATTQLSLAFGDLGRALVAPIERAMRLIVKAHKHYSR